MTKLAPNIIAPIIERTGKTAIIIFESSLINGVKIPKKIVAET